MKLIYATLVSILLTLLFSQSAFCNSKFVIKPRFTTSVRYDSNFYLTENNEREVYSFLIQPGILLGIERPKTKLHLNYTFERYYYDDVGSIASDEEPANINDYIGHLIALDLRHNPTRRLTVGLKDDFYRTLYPFNYDRLSDNVERRRYDLNRFTPLIFYDFENKFSLGLRYRKTDMDYYQTSLGDFTEHRGILNFLYNPTRKTTFDLEYQNWATDYKSGGSDYISNQVKLIFQKRFKYYTFDVGFGYHTRDFKDPQLQDGDIFAYKIAFTGQNPPPPETRRHLGEHFVRSKSHFFLSAERNFNDYGMTTNATRFTASAGHVFFKKIHTLIRGYYQINDFSEFGGEYGSREDRIFKVSGSIEYLITKKISLSLTAGREERESNMNGFDYINDYVLLKFDFNYDLGSRGGHTEEALYY